MLPRFIAHLVIQPTLVHLYTHFIRPQTCILTSYKTFKYDTSFTVGSHKFPSALLLNSPCSDKLPVTVQLYDDLAEHLVLCALHKCRRKKADGVRIVCVVVDVQVRRESSQSLRDLLIQISPADIHHILKCVHPSDPKVWSDCQQRHREVFRTGNSKQHIAP